MTPWKRFSTSTAKNIVGCYTRKNLLWQALAVALTYVIVISGFDWWYYSNTRDALLQSWLFPATVFGGIVPILLPAGLLLIGKITKNARATITGFAVMQAAFIGLLISSFYKVFTGRVQPPFQSLSRIDNSREFLFGIFRHGAFWGWPSSHTTVAFAVAVTIFVLYRNRPVITYSVLLAALYVGVGISTNIHWFSEFVAGAIIGSVVGTVVGRSFKPAL